MNKNVWLVCIIALFVFAGCSAIKEGYEDYKVGVTTPVQADEVAPKESAKGLVNLISGLPYVGPFAPVALPFFTAFFGWRRGRKIRQGLPTSTKPITGSMGNATGAELVVQTASDVLAGISEWGKDGSPLKRGIKVGISTATALTVAAFSIPQVQELLLTNPEIGAIITAISGGFAAVEKASSKVLPVEGEA